MEFSLQRLSGPGATLMAAFLLTGCGNLSGLDAGSHFACAAPPGVQCDSMSGVYHNSIGNSQRVGRTGEARHEGEVVATTVPIAQVPTSPHELRSAPRVLRLWIAPWEDGQHDLVDQSYVYMVVDHGAWLIDHARQHIREAYAPTRLQTAAVQQKEPPAAAAAAPSATTSSTSTSPTPVYPIDAPLPTTGAAAVIPEPPVQ